MKNCQRCNKKCPESDFRPNRNTCRKCKTQQHYAWVEKNKAKHSKYMREYRLGRLSDLKAYGEVYRRKAKLDAIRHYSNGTMKCQCCGESEVDFLNIDHINGGGTQERKVMKRGGNSFAIWLRARGFPEGFRILCYNCNCALAHFKTCPHMRVKNVALVQ